jgi:quinoprotein glucose dehydrogenase
LTGERLSVELAIHDAQPESLMERLRTSFDQVRTMIRNHIRNSCRITLSATITFAAILSAITSIAIAQEPQAPAKLDEKPESLIMSRFEKNPNLTVRIAADSDQLSHPIAFSVDDFGRVFVAESFRYIDLKGGWTDIRYRMDWMDQDLASRSIEDRRKLYESRLGAELADWKKSPERIRLLESPDESGVFRNSSIFADGFADLLDGTIAGLLATRDRVYVTNIPHLWEIQGANLSKSTSRKPLHTGFGVRLGYLGHDLHGLCWGPDGRLYFSLGDRGARIEKDGKLLANIPDTGGVFRCEADGSNLELYAFGLRNPQELAFDAYGNLWTCDNNADRGDKARWVWVLPGGDSGWRIGYQHLNTPGPLGAWTSEKIWYPAHADQAGHIVPPVANLAQGPSGVAAHPGTGLPTSYTGQFLVCDYLGEGGGIYSVNVRKKGAGFEMLPPLKFFWSTPANDVDFAPDGSVLFTTWRGGIAPTSSGALYRVESPGLMNDPLAQSTALILRQDPSKAEIDVLGAWLEHPDMRVRRHSQFELARRGQPAVDVFVRCIQTSPSSLARITAIWGLAQLQRLKQIPLPEEVKSWSNDPEPEFRAAVARVIGECRTNGGSKILASLLTDSDDHVKLWASLALVNFSDPDATKAIADLAVKVGDTDPWLRHGISSALAATTSPEELVKLHSSETPEPLRRAALIALKKRQHAGVAAFLNDPSPNIATDAARAIYEDRIAEAIPQLANFDPATTVSFSWNDFQRDAFLRRWLHINYRLGKQENVERISRFAADSRFSENLRVEAVGTLSHWVIQRPFDGVQGLYFEFDPNSRDSEAGKSQSETIVQLLMNRTSLPDLVRLVAIEFAGTNPGSKFVAPLREILDSTEMTPVARAKALGVLVRTDGVSSAELVKSHLNSEIPELKLAAIDAIDKLPLNDRYPIIDQVIRSGSFQEAQRAIKILATTTDKTSLEFLSNLVDRYAKGELPTSIKLEVREAIDRFGLNGNQLRKKIEIAKNVEQKNDPLSVWSDTLEGGNAAAGEALFRDRAELSCLRCHQPAESSQRVGPSLDDVGSRLTNRQILNSIVKPNDELAKGFETVTLALKDGTIVSGLTTEETEDRITLRNAEGNAVTFAKSEIEERTKGISLMPDKLDERISLRELRDLVAYLVSRKSPTTQPSK